MNENKNCRIITKIALTGGPCAGKTVALKRIKQYFEALGYSVVNVAETATELISAGITPWDMESTDVYQEHQIHLQLQKEKIICDAAKKLKGTSHVLVVCDRGVIDNKAYMSDGAYTAVLCSMGLDENTLRCSYDAVFHLVTAAKGAKASYTLEGNECRTETPRQAADLDDKIVEVWKAHPHYRVIDNSTGFDQKIERLIAEISDFLQEK